MRYLVFAILGLLLFACPLKAEMIDVTDDCTLEVTQRDAKDGGGYYSHASIHFRGAMYAEYDTVTMLAGAIAQIEGIMNLTPYPYQMSVSKGELYTWEEIREDLKAVMMRFYKEKSGATQ